MRAIGIAILVALAAGTGWWLTRADPATAIATLDALELPPTWRPAASERERGFLSPKSETRFYFVPGTAVTVLSDVSQVVTTADGTVDAASLPSCEAISSRPPMTACSVVAHLRDPLDRIEATVFNLEAAAEVLDAPWLTGAAAGEVVVRVTVRY